MPKILGLGGVFFLCKDADAYRDWWKTYMGVEPAPWGSLEWPSDGKAFTVMSPFKNESDYLKPSAHRYMINLRVDDAYGMLEKARAGGAEIIGDVEEHEYGVFGWFIDPEGIKIELWQEIDSPQS